MKLKVILVSLIILSIIPLYPPQQAFGAEITHYYEENNTCVNTTANDSPVITVTDGTDFNFIDGRKYLIIAKGEIGSDNSAENLSMSLRHGSTMFTGSNYRMEQTAGLLLTGSCTSDPHYFNYFFFVVWAPVGASQASENIILIADVSQASGTYEYDQASIFIMEISEDLTEDTDWHYDADTNINQVLGTSWDTPNDAQIIFTPDNNNDLWLIMCTTTLDTAQTTAKYHSRINAITDSVTVEVGEMEGEDSGADQYLQTGIYLTTIENSSHTFECEAQRSGGTASTHQRDYNAIFALNLDKFESQDFTQNLTPTGNPNSLGEIITLDYTPATTGDQYILAVAIHEIIGQTSYCEICQLQIDDVDQPTGNAVGDSPTAFWETADMGSWVEQKMMSLDTSTHNIDFDATDGAVSGTFNAKAIVAFSMELAPVTVDNFKTIENPMTMTDDQRFDIDIDVAQDPLTITDIVTVFREIDDAEQDLMTFTDLVTTTVTKNDAEQDPITMTDIMTPVKTLSDAEQDPITLTQILTIVCTGVCPQIPIPPSGGGGVGVGGDPTPIEPDSDGDGIIDSVDQCPLEIGTIANNGCPSIVLPPLLDFDFDIPIGFNELDVVDDFIILETEFPQPQVEDIAIRWLSNMPITITSVIIGESPFEIQIANIPLTIGDESFGFTQARLLYTVQEPDKICGDTFSFDCIDEVTYQIPIKISGVSDGNTIIADGTITIDNSGRFNPYWLLLLTLLVIPMIALILRKKSNARPELNKVFKFTSVKTNLRPLPKSKSQKSGTTKKSLKITQTRSRVELKKPTAERKFRSGTTKRLLRER